MVNATDSGKTTHLVFSSSTVVSFSFQVSSAVKTKLEFRGSERSFCNYCFLCDSLASEEEY